MHVFFRRLKFAFWSFFTILFQGRIPDPVLSALAPTRRAETPAEPPAPARPDATMQPTAVQMLAVLQRDGRLVDFLMEDIAPYADAQIGAAVRNVHAGCRRVLDQYLALAPALEGREGGTIAVDATTDPALVKAIGNVTGPAPLRGVLRHRGWVVSRIELPPLPASGQFVIAPAEVEVA